MSIKIGSKVEVLFFEEQACDATKDCIGEIMMKKEISLLEANQFNSSKESRKYLMSLLSAEEQKIFKDFVKQVNK